MRDWERLKDVTEKPLTIGEEQEKKILFLLRQGFEFLGYVDSSTIEDNRHKEAVFKRSGIFIRVTPAGIMKRNRKKKQDLTKIYDEFRHLDAPDGYINPFIKKTPSQVMADYFRRKKIEKLVYSKI